MTAPASSPRRILIVRISALGDLVFCSALLDGLRRAFPQAHLSWLVQPRFAGLLEGDARIDRVLRLPEKLRDIRDLLRGQAPFDWVIDAQGLLKTRLLARLAPAARRIGFASKEPGAFLMHECWPKGGALADIASEYRHLAQVLTGEDPGAPRLHPQPAERDAADAFLAAQDTAPGFIALCPFTTRPQKHWMEDYWPRLAQQLHARGHGPLALLGGPADRAAADRILAHMPPGTRDWVAATPLRLLPALLARAQLVVGVDTGLTHIGIAVRRPVVALFGSTCPYTRGAPDAPLRVMYDALPCSPCRRRPTCNGAFTCLRDLTPERVAQAALALLETRA